ncbi:MAG TPA: hypothetical protein P5268_01885 [Candidatus Marinimicrobia bacterium]|nr:hypothetical protein [Candidatus Neomarinimicrobiota bacterium]HRS50893.1 hypothetical protein [Candidatus Neomarinimicrobiota bacterium]HRU91765.1 hypothetical protein [Candidatus Neomarinimicrobiota bacterium]
MKFRILTVVLVIGLQNLMYSQEYIPSWFEELPEVTGVRLAVGYSGKFTNEFSAKSTAVQLARKNMAKQISIRLKFDVEELADGRLRLLNPSFKEFYEGAVLNAIESNSTVVDSAITTDGYFVLLAFPAVEYFSLPDAGDKTWSVRPDWIENLPEEDGYVYGIGMVARYSNWVRAWQDADEYARFDLGKNLQIEAESIHAVQRDNRTTIESVILKQSYDLTIEGATIVARWLDTANGVYYSLCRAPKP